mmetsp:Transcript_165531/g.293141  ORF Transcript_165531/g.293141 Transcript_165531/m.293141 type:complete len:262 (+) Transcript_165531:34-819(+)
MHSLSQHFLHEDSKRAMFQACLLRSFCTGSKCSAACFWLLWIISGFIWTPAAAGDFDFLDDAIDALGNLEARVESKKRKVAEEVPFFSLNLPLDEYIENTDPQERGTVVFNFFEPRYVMMAAEIEEGNRIYGYTDAYPPKPGGLGTLIDVHDGPELEAFHWTGKRPKGPVVVIGRPGPKFRILSVATRDAPGSKKKRGAPLFVGKVALLPEEEASADVGNKDFTEKRLISNALLSMGVIVEEDDLTDEFLQEHAESRTAEL